MGKWLKWLVVVVVFSQPITYFWHKYSLPYNIVSFLEENGCIGFEVFGADFPLNYLLSSEIEANIYLISTDDQKLNIKVNFIDTSPPFFKGVGRARYFINRADLEKHFTDCFAVE